MFIGQCAPMTVVFNAMEVSARVSVIFICMGGYRFHVYISARVAVIFMCMRDGVQVTILVNLIEVKTQAAVCFDCIESSARAVIILKL